MIRRRDARARRRAVRPPVRFNAGRLVDTRSTLSGRHCLGVGATGICVLCPLVALLCSASPSARRERGAFPHRISGETDDFRRERPPATARPRRTPSGTRFPVADTAFPVKASVRFGRRRPRAPLPDRHRVSGETVRPRSGVGAPRRRRISAETVRGYGRRRVRIDGGRDEREHTSFPVKDGSDGFGEGVWGTRSRTRWRTHEAGGGRIRRFRCARRAPLTHTGFPVKRDQPAPAERPIGRRRGAPGGSGKPPY